ncbi:hypothetical protein OnM2_c11602o2 [Erysiphe neolycopersici]|uniref:Uncharacterized protein n=1 Tax=Erysiphe neolycopersici TaxID=212602 RepID=A0A420I5V7_9PEZI|nr:hypothetical protein OnM2_c11602o2 [Erysiphe neolycopersici]
MRWSSGSLTNVLLSGFLFMLGFGGRKETYGLGSRSIGLGFCNLCERH